MPFQIKIMEWSICEHICIITIKLNEFAFVIKNRQQLPQNSSIFFLFLEKNYQNYKNEKSFIIIRHFE